MCEQLKQHEKRSHAEALHRSGRPRGCQFDANFNVRLPRPALDALRALSKSSRIPVARIVRAGIEFKLAEYAAELVKVAKNPDASPVKRMEMMERIREIGLVAVHFGPLGLEMARKRASDGNSASAGENSCRKNVR